MDRDLVSLERNTTRQNFAAGRVWIAVFVAALSLGIGLWQLTVPEQLTFYDTGVYFAATLHFVMGAMPYRDFTFVQPPGIVLLMSPVALLSRVLGTHIGLIIASCLSSLVTGVNAGLLAWLVRFSGRVAMLVAGLAMALLPVSFFVSSGLNLEPYCVLFVLLGALTVLSSDDVQSHSTTRGLVVGGALFGFAGLIKLWAFLPFVALVLCLVPLLRRRVMALVAGAVGVFTLLALPFFLSAPANFISQVFVDQAIRSGSNSKLFRLVYMTGFAFTSLAPTIFEAIIIFVLLALLVVSTQFGRATNGTIDRFLMFSSVLVFVAFFIPGDYYNYYPYFTAPFFIGMFAISISRLVTLIGLRLKTVRISPVVRRLATLVGSLSAIGFVFAVVLYITSFYSAYAFGYGVYGPWLAPITSHIPKNACVVYDIVGYGVYANRLIASDPHCSEVVDPIGMWLAHGDGLVAPSPSYVAEWKKMFRSAQYVVLSSPTTINVPWDSSLHTWFHRNFQLIYSRPNGYVFIYEKVRGPG